MQRSIDENLNIKMFELNHDQDLFELTKNNREHFGRWLQFAHETKSVEDTKRFIARSLHKYATNDGFWSGIWDENRLIGAIGFLYFDWENKATELGYYLSKEHESKGIITRACRLMIDYAFKEVGLQRIVIQVISENTRSRKIPERLGFTQEGVMRRAEWFIDHYVDKVLYGILRDEWK